MRIALISPYSSGPLRGNITTVNRISHFLSQAGLELLVLPVDTLSAAEMECQLRAFAPQLIHAFHAHYCGRIAQHLADRLKLPFVITITGSDLHDPLLREQSDTVSSIGAAQTVTCFDACEAAELVGYFPEVAARVTVIAQGVELLPVAATESFGVAEDDFVLLLPAALRPVKQIEFPLQALAPLVRRFPALRLVIAGGIIDQDYAAAIRSMLCAAPFAVWLGEIPRERMGALYSRADVVLNCSRFESMPNSLMEAMALGRPVVAADISGNRTLVHHGETGLLYRDPDSFCGCVAELAENGRLRAALGKRAGEYLRGSFSPQHEAAKYIRLYEALCG